MWCCGCLPCLGGGGDHTDNIPVDIFDPAMESVLEDEEQLPFLHGTLKIHVIEAADLPDTDNCLFNISKGDWTDPFVVLYLGQTPMLKTAYLPNNLNPVWNERFSLPVCHRTSSIKVVVHDREHIGDQVVGTALIATEELIGGEPIEQWYDIITDGFGTVQGKIHIMMQFFPIGALGECNHYLADSYFQPKTDNSVRLYMTADTPQLPQFDGVTEPDGSPYVATRCWIDIYNAICNAEKFIYVTGWSVYTAINLIRGEEAVNYPDTNIGELLKRKAEEGVRVCVMTWNEKSNDGGLLDGMMGTHDEETFNYFAGTDVVCANVPRAKKSWMGLGGQFVGTMYTHHQKNVICDADCDDDQGMRRVVAFIGGIDLTDGRYDTPEFHLFKTLYTCHAGDFYQNCTVGATADSGPREPWEDIHAFVSGPTAVDIHANFADRWLQQNLSLRDSLYTMNKDEFALDHPGDVNDDMGGPWTLQLFRSITSDSAVMSQKDRLEFLSKKYGRPLEESIMKQYVNIIRNAKSFIYIENQYFLGSAFAWMADQDVLSHHVIPIELVEKIINMMEQGSPFHVYVTIPMYPEGDPTSVPSQEIIFWQYRTMQMMYKRLHRAIERLGLDAKATDYLSFYCLGKRESPDEVPDDLCPPEPGTQAELVRGTLRHPIYVHSKLMIADDEYFIVGSANINQRSMGGNRDTEICVGGFQPNCQHDGSNPPNGGIHTFRVALWSAHLGGYDPVYENPGTAECLEKVREVTSEFWEVYTADEPTHSDVHMMPYPLLVSETGDLSPYDPPWHVFPDTVAPVVGAKSGLLPVKLTT